ncbi:MAG: hypothetical protein K2J85_00250, partial [Anaeroplasmataceae bacterium]|nr:hypothetical protein [Anaeroplasmataceae bacterium]
MKKNKYFLFALLLFLIPSISTKAMEEEVSYTHVHVIDYDHPISFEEIKVRYTSYDLVDGNLTSKITFYSEYESDYENNTLSVKNYELMISVTNSRNKTITWLDEISVRDFTAPILEGLEKQITIDISTEDIVELLTSTFIITDNWDKEFSKYDFKGIEALEQGPGVYSICCSVIDSSGNISNEISLIIHLEESIQRQISLTPIQIENQALSTQEVITLFLQNNTVDTGYQSVQVQSSYFDTPSKEGIYQAEFTFHYADGYKQIYQCKLINTILKEK